jgi:hypothetical protein
MNTEPETRLLSTSDPDVKFSTTDLLGPLCVWPKEREATERRVALLLDRFRMGELTYRETMEQLSGLVADARMRTASRLLHEMLWHRLPPSPAASAIRKILIGSDYSLRAEAENTGCSHEAIRKAEKKLRRTLQLPEE